MRAAVPQADPGGGAPFLLASLDPGLLVARARAGRLLARRRPEALVGGVLQVQPRSRCAPCGRDRNQGGPPADLGRACPSVATTGRTSRYSRRRWWRTSRSMTATSWSSTSCRATPSSRGASACTGSRWRCEQARTIW